jgi:hypothetical protein
VTRALLTIALLLVATEALAARAEWRMDEPAWDGTAGEIIDSRGGFHGTAFNATTVADGATCRAGDFTNDDAYAVLDDRVLEGRRFTIALRFQTSYTGEQVVLSAANAGQPAELVLRFTNATTFSPIVRGVSRNVSVPNIADGEWHQLVYAQDNNRNCVWINGTPLGCELRTPPRDISVAPGGLIVGQRQSVVGGGFDPFGGL